MDTIYANQVEYRLTPTEFILEFTCAVPKADLRQGMEVVSQAQIVMLAGVAEPFVKALQDVIKEHNEKQKGSQNASSS